MFLYMVSHTVNRNGVKMQHNIVLLDLQACQAGVILITSKLHVDTIPEIYRSRGVFLFASGGLSCQWMYELLNQTSLGTFTFCVYCTCLQKGQFV